MAMLQVVAIPMMTAIQRPLRIIAFSLCSEWDELARPERLLGGAYRL
jgi:hypothetical protein